MGKIMDAKNMSMNMATMVPGTGGYLPVSAQVTSPASLASLGNGQESDESQYQVTFSLFPSIQIGISIYSSLIKAKFEFEIVTPIM